MSFIKKIQSSLHVFQSLYKYAKHYKYFFVTLFVITVLLVVYLNMTSISENSNAVINPQQVDAYIVEIPSIDNCERFLISGDINSVPINYLPAIVKNKDGFFSVIANAGKRESLPITISPGTPLTEPSFIETFDGKAHALTGPQCTFVKNNGGHVIPKKYLYSIGNSKDGVKLYRVELSISNSENINWKPVCMASDKNNCTILENCKNFSSFITEDNQLVVTCLRDNTQGASTSVEVERGVLSFAESFRWVDEPKIFGKSYSGADGDFKDLALHKVDGCDIFLAQEITNYGEWIDDENYYYDKEYNYDVDRSNITTFGKLGLVMEGNNIYDITSVQSYKKLLKPGLESEPKLADSLGLTAPDFNDTEKRFSEEQCQKIISYGGNIPSYSGSGECEIYLLSKVVNYSVNTYKENYYYDKENYFSPYFSEQNQLVSSKIDDENIPVFVMEEKNIYDLSYNLNKKLLKSVSEPGSNLAELLGLTADDFNNEIKHFNDAQCNQMAQYGGTIRLKKAMSTISAYLFGDLLILQKNTPTSSISKAALYYYDGSKYTMADDELQWELINPLKVHKFIINRTKDLEIMPTSHKIYFFQRGTAGNHPLKLVGSQNVISPYIYDRIGQIGCATLEGKSSDPFMNKAFSMIFPHPRGFSFTTSNNNVINFLFSIPAINHSHGNTLLYEDRDFQNSEEEEYCSDPQPKYLPPTLIGNIEITKNGDGQYVLGNLNLTKLNKNIVVLNVLAQRDESIQMMGIYVNYPDPSEPPTRGQQSDQASGDYNVFMTNLLLTDLDKKEQELANILDQNAKKIEFNYPSYVDSSVQSYMPLILPFVSLALPNLEQILNQLPKVLADPSYLDRAKKIDGPFKIANPLAESVSYFDFNFSLQDIVAQQSSRSSEIPIQFIKFDDDNILTAPMSLFAPLTIEEPK
ncbi:MAG: hypothetical protein HQK53_06600 [Oligoflexia bacterium]|nr:hypothetical protein [Oligoflexia bacterium]